jgi:hypothetical protein
MCFFEVLADLDAQSRWIGGVVSNSETAKGNLVP